MPAKQNKAGTWNVVKKDGTLGKRNFSTKSNALAAQRGPKKAGKAKPKGKRKGGSKAATTSNPNKAPGTGKLYQGARLTALVVAPVTDRVIVVAQGRRTIGQGITDLKGKARHGSHVRHQLVNVADLTIDRNKHVQQAASLSRMSVTAWLPEALVAARTAEDFFVEGINDPSVLHRRYVERVNGYDPGLDKFTASKAREYRVAKHLGQAIRVLGSGERKVPIVSRVANVLRTEILNPLGATL